jgi:hypothetical protein
LCGGIAPSVASGAPTSSPPGSAIFVTKSGAAGNRQRTEDSISIAVIVGRGPLSSIVDPALIDGPYLTAALRAIVFPLPIAYPRRYAADLGLPVCRNPIDYHSRPLPHLLVGTSALYLALVNGL